MGCQRLLQGKRSVFRRPAIDLAVKAFAARKPNPEIITCKVLADHLFLRYQASRANGSSLCVRCTDCGLRLNDRAPAAPIRLTQCAPETALHCSSGQSSLRAATASPAMPKFVDWVAKKHPDFTATITKKPRGSELRTPSWLKTRHPATAERSRKRALGSRPAARFSFAGVTTASPDRVGSITLPWPARWWCYRSTGQRFPSPCSGRAGRPNCRFVGRAGHRPDG